jgi:hypothetical protein
MPSFLQPSAYSIGAQPCRRLDLLVEDLRLEVLRRDDNGRHEELRRRVVELPSRLRRLALDQLERDLGGSGSDDLARLGDRVVLIAGDDQLQRRNGRVVAGDGGTGLTPAALNAAIAPPPVPSFAATRP